MQNWGVALCRNLLAPEAGNRVNAGVLHSYVFGKLWLLG